MASSAGEIRIEPVNVTWLEFEQSLVKTVADVSDSLDGLYFTLAKGGDILPSHYVWMDGVAAADPAPAGLTAIPVAYTTGDSAAVIAGLIQVAVDAVGDFEASVSGDEITITSIVAADTAQTVDVDTGFTFTQCAEGKNIFLGLLDGSVEVSTEEALLDISAHQTGTTLVTQLRQGVSSEIGLTLKETSLANFEAVYARGAGGTFTPGGGTELIGWGNVKQGTNVIVQAGLLNLHPVALDPSDLSRDLTFWKAYPTPESLTYSGEEPNVIAVTFKTFIDDNKDSNVNLFAFGDYPQLNPA